MSIKLIIRNEEHFLEPMKNLSVKKAMEHLEILPEAYLAIRNGEILVEHEHLLDGDIIKFIPVISGG
jgi:sulfur carrier protein ThiS